EGREHDLNRPFNQSELQQEGIDEAVVAEDNDPGIGPYDLAEEERRHSDNENGGLDQPVLGMHQRVGNRVRDYERTGRGKEADPDRVEADAGGERLSESRQ